MMNLTVYSTFFKNYVESHRYLFQGVEFRNFVMGRWGTSL